MLAFEIINFQGYSEYGLGGSVEFGIGRELFPEVEGSFL